MDELADAGPDLTVTVAQTPLNADYVEQAELRIPETGVKNMPNPSFEENTLPGFPFWVLRAHGCMTLSQTTPGVKTPSSSWMPGRTSCMANMRAARVVILIFKLCPQPRQPTPYVWSAWMRADRPGVTVRFGGDGISKQAAALPRQRNGSGIMLLTVRHARRHNGYALSVATEDPAACVWVDAMQFELGAEPTEFEP